MPSHVWIRSSILEETQGGDGDDINSDGFGWGWVLAEKLSSDDDDDVNESNDISRFRIIDKDCTNCHDQDIDIPTSLLNATNVVNANDTDASEDVIPPDNLTSLTHLHEASVVHSLRKRYLVDKIYTATGGIVLAVNPFKRITEPDDFMDQYWKRGVLRERTVGGDDNSSDDDDRV